MQEYLLAQGIPATAIYQDPHGYTTYLTARNVQRIMDEHGFESAMVITQYFHISRARLALQRCGIRDVAAGHARYREWRDLYSILREVPALFTYAVRACPT